MNITPLSSSRYAFDFIKPSSRERNASSSFVNFENTNENELSSQKTSQQEQVAQKENSFVQGQNYINYTPPGGVTDSSADTSQDQSGRINPHSEYTNRVIEKVKNGESLVDAMLNAKLEVFELLLEETIKEQTEKGYTNIREAVELAKCKLNMDISDQEVLGVVQDMISELDTNKSRTEEEDILLEELVAFALEKDIELNAKLNKTQESYIESGNIFSSDKGKQNSVNEEIISFWNQFHMESKDILNSGGYNPIDMKV